MASAPEDSIAEPAGRLDRTLKQPLWAQLQTDLRRRIDRQELDDEFPGEHALAESYQVSRQTVRLALRALREEGVVSAGKGRQPRVSHTIRQPMGALYSLFTSVESGGMEQRSVVLTLDERTDAAAARHLGLAAGDPVVFLERLRLADDEPLAVDQAWLPARVARPLLQVDFTHTALYTEMARLIDRAPIGGQEEIAAVVVTAAQAAQLTVAPGSPAFLLQRLGCYHGIPVEWRRTLIRADRFRLLSEFSPGSGYTLQLGAAARPRPMAETNNDAPIGSETP
jgi:GntR family transcriptional regulator